MLKGTALLKRVMALRNMVDMEQCFFYSLPLLLEVNKILFLSMNTDSLYQFLHFFSSFGEACTEAHTDTIYGHTDRTWSGVWSSYNCGGSELSTGFHGHGKDEPPPNALHLSPNTDIRVCICDGRAHLQEDYRPGHDPCRPRAYSLYLSNFPHGTLHLHLQLVLGYSSDVRFYHECYRPCCSRSSTQRPRQVVYLF